MPHCPQLKPKTNTFVGAPAAGPLAPFNLAGMLVPLLWVLTDNNAELLHLWRTALDPGTHCVQEVMHPLGASPQQLTVSAAHKTIFLASSRAESVMEFMLQSSLRNGAEARLPGRPHPYLAPSPTFPCFPSCPSPESSSSVITSREYLSQALLLGSPLKNTLNRAMGLLSKTCTP